MEDGALVLVWGDAVRGREQQALATFNDVLAFWTRMQSRGEITSFEPVALEPNGGTLSGLMIVRGDPARLAQVRQNEEFQHLTSRCVLICDNFGVHTGFRGEALRKLYADWGALASSLTGEHAGARTPAYMTSVTS